MSDRIACETCLYNKNCQFLLKHPHTVVADCTAYKNAADFVEVRHGHWVYHRGAIGYHDCSVCGTVISQTQLARNYCPHCGAKMDEDVYCDGLNVPDGYTFEVGM